MVKEDADFYLFQNIDNDLSAWIAELYNFMSACLKLIPW